MSLASKFARKLYTLTINRENKETVTLTVPMFTQADLVRWGAGVEMPKPLEIAEGGVKKLLTDDEGYQKALAESERLRTYMRLAYWLSEGGEEFPPECQTMLERAEWLRDGIPADIHAALISHFTRYINTKVAQISDRAETFQP